MEMHFIQMIIELFYIQQPFVADGAFHGDQGKKRKKEENKNANFQGYFQECSDVALGLGKSRDTAYPTEKHPAIMNTKDRDLKGSVD